MIQAFAHSGHWSVSLLYLLPFAAVGVWILRDRRRERRARMAERNGATSGEGPPAEGLAAPGEGTRPDPHASDGPTPRPI